MRPKIRSNGPRMTFAGTSYEPQRRRLQWIAKIESCRLQAPAPVIRRAIARALHLSPDQVINIGSGRRKNLYADIRDRIDSTFIVLAQRHIRELKDELALAQAHAGAVDPDVVAETKASVDALAALINEFETASPGREEESC